MTKNSRVTHVTRNYSMKFGQVQKRIAENACFVWVKYGETFRDATFQEAAQMRKEQAKTQEPIAFAENPGLKVIWKTPQQQAIQRHSYSLISAANEFCLAHA